MGAKNGWHSVCLLLIKISIVISTITLLSSCMKIQNSSLYIPQDVFFAARANILRATYQVPNWKDILRQEFSIDVEADSTPPTNFLSSGKAYVFGNMTQGDQNYVAFSLSIFNSKSLQRFITTLNPDLELKTYKNFQYLVKNKSLLAWSSNVLLLIDAPQAANEDYLANHFIHIVDVKKKDALIMANENFRQALRNDNDVALWVNGSKLKHSPILEHFTQGTSFDSSYMHLKANFDEGVITTETEFFANQALKRGYEKLLSRGISTPLLSYLPIKKPVALVSFSAEPDHMARALIDFNWLSKANNLATSTTFTLSHFQKMLSGDVIFALKDIITPEKDSLATDKDTKPKKVTSDFVLGFGIRDKAAFDELVKVMEETGMLTKHEGYYNFFDEIYVMPTDTLVYLTKNPTIQADFAKGLVLDRPDLIKKATDNCFLLYANEALTDKSIQGKTMVKEIARNLLGNENLQLNEAYLTFSRTGTSQTGGTSLILLKDEMENALLAMLEVLKEVVSQTKIRLDPNYFNPE